MCVPGYRAVKATEQGSCGGTSTSYHLLAYGRWCICHFTKWQIHPFISKWTVYNIYNIIVVSVRISLKSYVFFSWVDHVIPTALSGPLHGIGECLDEGFETDVIYLDFSKALTMYHILCLSRS